MGASQSFQPENLEETQAEINARIQSCQPLNPLTLKKIDLHMPCDISDTTILVKFFLSIFFAIN